MIEYLEPKEAMEYLGIKTRKNLNYYIEQGLPVIKIGKFTRISKTAIDNFMRKHTIVTTRKEF